MALKAVANPFIGYFQVFNKSIVSRFIKDFNITASRVFNHSKGSVFQIKRGEVFIE